MDSRSAIPAELTAILDDARSLGFLGPGPVAQQVDHSRGFAHAYEAGVAGDPRPARPPRPDRWLDLGSGGGIPGLVLALVWPDTEAVLLDSAERRTRFLEDAVVSLGWAGRVQVVRARAEDAGIRPALRAAFDAVVARSFGAPPVTAECAAPFLRPGGALIVSEPPAPEADSPPLTSRRWPAEGLATVGQEPGVLVRNGYGYQVIRQAHPCPDRFPRRMGVAAKRPIYQVGARG